MSDLRAVLRHSPVYVIAALLNRGASFLLVLIYVAYFDEGGYGLVGAAMALAEVAGILLSLQMAEALARLFFDHPPGPERDDTVATALISILALTLVGTVLLAITAPWFGPLIAGTPGHELILIMAGTAAGFEALFNAGLTTLRADLRSTEVLVWSTFRSATLLGFSALAVVVFKMGPEGAIGALLVSGLLAALGLAARLLYRGGRFRWNRVQTLGHYGLALCPAWGAEALAKLVERTAVVQRCGLMAAGWWYLALRLADVLTSLVQGPFQQVWLVRRLELFRRGEPDLDGQRTFTTFAAVMALAALILAAFAPEIIALLARRPGYAPTAELMPATAMAVLLFAFCTSIELGLHLGKRPGRLTLAVMASAVVNGVLAWWAATQFGILGVAWARVASTAVRCATLAIAARNLPGPRPPWLSLAAITTIMAVTLAILHVIQPTSFLIRIMLVMMSGATLGCWSWRARRRHVSS